MSFVHAVRPALEIPPDRGSVIVIAQDRQLARLAADGTVQLPTLREVHALADAGAAALHLGTIDDGACWLLDVREPEPRAPDGWAWHETRALLQTTRPAQAQAIACARQLRWWLERNRFCGACGAPTVDAEDERARRCPTCGAMFFPSAAPAVIVAVTRDDRLLLAHNRNWRPGMFSLLAGFLDPGETLEQAVVREVREETGLEIGDLRYVTSQPWPFPNSLMAGFRAEHVSGEIVVDGHEITEAGWFTRDALPDLPRRGTVARELIDGWVRQHASR